MLYIFAVTTLAIGYLVGRDIDMLRKKVKELEDRKPEVGATQASYGVINDYNFNQSGDTGLVRPKTPQQLEYEEEEALRQAQLNVRVK